MGKAESAGVDWTSIGRRRKVQINALICLFWAAVFILPIAIGDLRLHRWELRTGDFLTDNRGGGVVDDQLVLVGIDDASLNVLDVLDEDRVVAEPSLDEMSFGFPFPRSVYARMTEKLLDAGARLVVFDMLFTDEKEEDVAFKAVIGANPGRVVIGSNYVEPELAQVKSETARPYITMPSASVLEVGDEMDPRLGFVNFFPDVDSHVRAINPVLRMFDHEGDPLRHSLAVAVLKQLDENVKIDSSGRVQPIRFPKFDVLESPYTPIPFYSLFVADDWEKNYGGGSVFEDKIVYIGGTSILRFHDVVDIPEGLIQGVQLQMSALAAARRADFYSIVGKWGGIASVVAMALAAFGVAFVMRRPVLGLLVLFAAAALYLILVRWCYFDFSILLPSTAPMLTFGFAGISCLGSSFAMEQLEKARLRRTLERQVSKELAEHILSRPEDYFESLPGVRKPVTVLFSDIRSFTSRSEKDDPVQLVSQLKEYLDAMGKIVFEHGGVVDKFIGDAVMAVWGNIRSEGPEKDSRNAVAAAVAMQVRLSEMNDRWAAVGREGFEIGIGLNHGDAIFGMMGSQQKQEMTVIGDPVNQAARLEGLTKKFGLGIIVGSKVAEYVGGEFALRSLGKVRTMGKEEGEELAAVLSEAGDAGQADWLRRFHEALEAFRSGELEVAKDGFAKCGEEQPGDLAVLMFLAAIESGEGRGELVMTGK